MIKIKGIIKYTKTVLTVVTPLFPVLPPYLIFKQAYLVSFCFVLCNQLKFDSKLSFSVISPGFIWKQPYFAPNKVSKLSIHLIRKWPQF